MAHFLIIDDDNAIRQLIGWTVQQAGHEVTQAVNGRDGVALFRQRRPDVLITDLVMPADSLELVLLLRHENPTLPIILVSGVDASSPLSRSATEALRAKRTLPKPVRLAELVQAASEVLTEEGIADASVRRRSEAGAT